LKNERLSPIIFLIKDKELFMTPEEFYDRVEDDNYEYRTQRYHGVLLRRSPEYNQLKGREEAAKYVMDVLYRLNLKDANYIPAKEKDERRSFLIGAAEDVKRKIGRLRQSQSQEREKYIIMADALEAYYKQMILLPWVEAEEVDAYLKKQQQSRLRDLVEAVKVVERNLSLATMGMAGLRQTLEELELLKEYTEDRED
jgi:hypothetical protein